MTFKVWYFPTQVYKLQYICIYIYVCVLVCVCVSEYTYMEWLNTACWQVLDICSIWRMLLATYLSNLHSFVKCAPATISLHGSTPFYDGNDVWKLYLLPKNRNLWHLKIVIFLFISIHVQLHQICPWNYKFTLEHTLLWTNWYQKT